MEKSRFELALVNFDDDIFDEFVRAEELVANVDDEAAREALDAVLRVIRRLAAAG